MLDALGAEGLLVDDVGRREPLLHRACFAVHFTDDVVLGAGDARLRSFVVDDRGAGGHRLLRVDDVRELLVRHDAAAPLLGRRLALRDHGGDALADVADGVVEQPGVVGVLGGVLVAGGGVGPFRGVVVGEDQVDAGDAQGGGRVDGEDAGVRVRGAQELHVEEAGDVDVEGVARGAGHHLGPGRGTQIPADGLSGVRLIGVPYAAHRVLDDPVAGAAADVPLERPGRSVSCSSSRAAVVIRYPAVQNPHWNPCASRNCRCTGWSSPSSPASPSTVVTARPSARTAGVEATVHRLPVDVHRARPAIPRVTALLDAEPAAFTEVGAQTLTGARLVREGAPVDVDPVTHAVSPEVVVPCAVSSRRISSAKRSALCHRHGIALLSVPVHTGRWRCRRGCCTR